MTMLAARAALQTATGPRYPARYRRDADRIAAGRFGNDGVTLLMVTPLLVTTASHQPPTSYGCV